jgi:hypothetical protein
MGRPVLKKRVRLQRTEADRIEAAEHQILQILQRFWSVRERV